MCINNRNRVFLTFICSFRHYFIVFVFGHDTDYIVFTHVYILSGYRHVGTFNMVKEPSTDWLMEFTSGTHPGQQIKVG